MCARTIAAGYELLGGPICNPCYSRLRREAFPCPSCGVPKVLAFHDEDLNVVCAACAGVPSRFACRSCGSEEQLTGAQCGTCRLKDRASKVLAREDGTLHPGFVSLYEHLLSAPDARNVTRWLKRDGISTALRRMALGIAPISHTTLDLLGPSPRIRYLRRLLISAKTLPEIDIYVNDLDLFAQRLLETLSTEHAHVLRRFYRWHILRSLSRRYPNTHASSAVVDGRRHQLTAIRDLLAWLEGQGQSLSTATQGDLDYYFAQIANTGNALMTFLTWARTNRHVTDVEVQRRAGTSARPAVSEGERWQHIDRLLDDDKLPVTTRIVGLFVLLFAQSLATCAQMKHSDVTITDESVSVRFATDPVTMPRAVGDLLRTYVNDPVVRTIYRTEGTEWLFSGLMPTTHITPSRLGELLLAVGISPSTAKDAAMRHLATALPARVVADAFGVAESTAARWSQLSGGTWNDYPRLREQN